MSVATQLPAVPENKRKVFVKSYGCQMNVYDSTRMVDSLADQGFEETAEVEQADVVILNTCHIRERATEKIFSELGKIKRIKQQRLERGLETRIGVAGCVAQAEGGEIFRRQKAVDFVVGPQNYHRLPALLDQVQTRSRVQDTEFPAEQKFDFLPAPSDETIRRRGISAFVTIQEGCDKFCTFCVVPYTRGAETSRPVAQILEEVATLARSGVREVSLLGQNVNAYHGDDGASEGATLARLISRIAEIPGIARVRYTTSHPNDMMDDLIDAHRTEPALMPFLHLPVQSGSDRILEAMNRKHGAADYVELIARVRRARPDIALSSDFIVGFPGETEDDFRATLDLIEQVGFASTFFFKYSPRPGTPGADLADQVDEPTKQDRLKRLQDLVEAQRADFNKSMVGRSLDVLVERRGRHPGQLVGKSPYMQPVQFDGADDLIGEVVNVQIVGVSTNSLFGESVNQRHTVSGARD